MKKCFLLTVAGVMIASSLWGQTNLTAPFSGTPPTIDGVIGGAEWQDAQSYNLTFHHYSDPYTEIVPVYLLNDGTFLYCASTAPAPYSPLTGFVIVIDGDHSHSINGTMSEPHRDLSYSKAGGPSGMNDGYYAEVPPCRSNQVVTPPAGAEHAYSGTYETSYEFKIPLSDMTTTPGETIGIFLHFSGGYGDLGLYLYPTVDFCAIADWPDLYIEPAPTCCIGRVGDANGQGDYPDEITLGDIMLMVDALFISSDCTKLACPDEADVNQSGGANPPPELCLDYVTLGDIMTLVDFLFITGPETAVLLDCL